MYIVFLRLLYDAMVWCRMSTLQFILQGVSYKVVTYCQSHGMFGELFGFRCLWFCAQSCDTLRLHVRLEFWVSTMCSFRRLSTNMGKINVWIDLLVLVREMCFLNKLQAGSRQDLPRKPCMFLLILWRSFVLGLGIYEIPGRLFSGSRKNIVFMRPTDNNVRRSPWW